MTDPQPTVEGFDVTADRLLEWPDGTRIEVCDANGRTGIYWRDDRSVPAGEPQRHWLAGGIDWRSQYTWHELETLHGDHLAAAGALYPPAATPGSSRPVTVLLTYTGGHVTHAWCYADADDARDAYNAGVGSHLLPSVALAPGVALQQVMFHTGWARIGRQPCDDVAPHIVRVNPSWAVPGAHIPGRPSGDDLDGLAEAGIDIIDLWCTGPDPDDVLTGLEQRYETVRDSRDAAATWRPVRELLM